MALGKIIKAADNARPDINNRLLISVSIESDWMTVVDAGGADNQDAATITDPDAEITETTSHKVQVNGRGTTFLCRGKYDDGDTSITDNIVQIFGKDANGLWMRLLDAAGNHKLSLVTDLTNNVSDGTSNWTDPVEVDMQGCTEVLVGVSTLYAATGDATLASIEGKIK